MPTPYDEILQVTLANTEQIPAGAWKTRTGSGAAFLDGVAVDNNLTASVNELKRLTLPFTLPQDGYYRIFIYTPTTSGSVFDDTGTWRLIDSSGLRTWTHEFQYTKNGWIELGVYHLTATGCSIGIETPDNAEIGMDAVRVVYEGETYAETPRTRVALPALSDGLDAIRNNIVDEFIADYDTSLSWNKHVAWQRNRRLMAYWNGLFKSTASMDSLPGLYWDRRQINEVWPIAYSMMRISEMAHAYYFQPNSGDDLGRLYQNTTLRDDLVRAVEWLATNYIAGNDVYDWSTDTPFGGAYNGSTWFHHEIIIPECIGHILMTLGPYLSAGCKQAFANYLAVYRDNNTLYVQYNTSGGSPAVDLNLVAIQKSWLLRGINENDTSKLTNVKGVLDTVFSYQTSYIPSDNGFWVDGGAMKDEAAEMFGYFNDMIELWGRMKRWLDGSAFALNPASSTTIEEFVQRGFEPYFTNQGTVLPVAFGRAIAVESGQGTGLAAGLTQDLAGALTGFSSTLLEVIVRRNLSLFEDEIFNTFNEATLRNMQSIVEAGRIATGGTAPATLDDRYRVLNSIGQMVVRRPEWALVIKGESDRIRGGKCILKTNKRPWYQGCGTMYLEIGDQRFDDAMIPTMDAYRWPGTTIIPSQARVENEDNPLASNIWCGGAAVEDVASAWSIDFENGRSNHSSDLVAKKSVFAFPDRVVFLGAGITTTDSGDVTTIVDQIRIGSAGDNLLEVDGVSQPPTTLGWSETALAVDSLFVECENGKTEGIVFDQPTDLVLSRTARTDAWSNITEGQDSSAKTRNYLTFEVAHGAVPTNAAYAYSIFPNISAADLLTATAATVIANTAQLQAVSLGNTTMATVWSAPGSPAAFGDFTVDYPCVFVAVKDGTDMHISIAQPNGNSDTVTITHPDFDAPVDLTLQGDYQPIGTTISIGDPNDVTPDPNAADVFYVPSYFAAHGGDLAGLTDATDAFTAALTDAELYASTTGPATVYLGEGTLRMHPKSWVAGFNSPMLALMEQSDVHIAGKWNGTMGGATRIFFDAAPLVENDPPRDPADSILKRGEAFHIRSSQNNTFRDFWLDGQAPITPNAGASSSGSSDIRQADGWDWTHKAFLWQYDVDSQRCDRLKITRFRGEMIYAPGDADPDSGLRPGSITIDHCHLEECNGSLFSCSASMTATNCVVRACYNGVENYAFPGQSTYIAKNDIQPIADAYMSHGYLLNGVSYTITGNTGADFTGLGAPNNDIGTTFTASFPVSPWAAEPVWGTGGEVKKTIGSNGIVVFGHKTASAVVEDNYVKGALVGFLSTDFAHNVTFRRNEWVDCPRTYVLTSRRTSSSESDYDTQRGWDNFTFEDEIIHAETVGCQAIFSLQAGGTRVPHNWQIDRMVTIADVQITDMIFQGGVEDGFVFNDCDFAAVTRFANPTNISDTTPRAKLNNCTNIPELVENDYGTETEEDFFPLTDGGSVHFRDVNADTINIPVGPYPEGFVFLGRSSDETFTITYGTSSFPVTPGLIWTMTYSGGEWSSDQVVFSSPIKAGTASVRQLYLGSTPAIAAYKGSLKVWES
jgi:hypothetical protein